MKIICIDFDGVLHSYTSGWLGATTIPDPPVAGAIEWLLSLCNDPDLSPVIYSSRSRYHGAGAAMEKWLIQHGVPEELLGNSRIKLSAKKPPAHLTIDDRAVRFAGEFPSIQAIKEFRPWNKGGRTAVQEAVDTLTTAVSEDASLYAAYHSTLSCIIQHVFAGNTNHTTPKECADEAATRFLTQWGCGRGPQ